MNCSRATRASLGAVLSVALVGCRPHASTYTRDECRRNPPDSMPIPPITVRVVVGIPGQLVIAARDLEGRVVNANAVLDRKRWAGSDSGAVSFNDVTRGEHRITFRSFGYGQRDTIVAMPADSGLRLFVPFSTGGGIRGCSTWVFRKETPWWRFW
jgi:hypothetical protein